MDRLIEWRLLTDDEALKVWDEALQRFSDYSPFQSYAWGEYRRALGWEPCRWAAFDERGEIVALMLGLLRRYPLKVGMVWSEGGPVGDLSVCASGLQQAIKKTTGLKRVYCRFRCDRERSAEDALRLNAQGWCRSWFNLTPNFSMTLDLSKDEESLLAATDRNWRRNLRRATEKNLNVEQWFNPSAEEVHEVYASMQSTKGLDEQMSLEEIRHLIANFKRNLVLYRCNDDTGELVSILGWLILGERAWAVLWATSERGRNLNSSHAIFWALVKHCVARGVQSCDLAGIDPVMNHGVYRFKRDTGAKPLEYLGEWDWATSSWLKWCGNWAISRRNKLKRAELRLNASRRQTQNLTVPTLATDLHR